VAARTGRTAALTIGAHEKGDNTVKLEGRVGLVFGGASGIGQACAEALTAEGESVVIADVNDAGAEAVIAGIAAAGGTAVYVRTDITDESAVEAAVAATVARFGKLDTVVTSAGAGIRGGEGAWEKGVDLFLKGPFYVSRHVLPELERSGGGTLIHVGSVASIRGSIQSGGVEGTAYPASKHGILGITKTLALAYGDKNIRVNTICPGYIKTDLTRRLYEAPDGERYAKDVLKVPLGRWGEPDDIGKVAAFLASDDAAFISGQAIVVDGGLTAR
jgi:NAD(P)-dependent dehydrogenase (short-subunit alcohol dehydrogenase family)